MIRNRFLALLPGRVCLATMLSVLLISTWSRASGLDEAALKALSGGDTTVFDTTRNAFTLAARNLRPERKAAFFTGNSFFNENWVVAPASTSGRDGLGPLFIARSCSACHFKDGRDRAPSAGALAATAVFRLSQPGRDSGTRGPLPHPVYGGQLQTRALPGLQAEAGVVVDWKEEMGRYPDGQNFSLRRPHLAFTNETYGPIDRGTLVSVRLAPAVIGLGLLEAVSEETLRDLADPEDTNGDGISGRINRVWEVTGKRRAIGRFGWKAEQPSVRQQVCGAFNDDMGLTTSMFPEENLFPEQMKQIKFVSGGSPEVSDEILEAVVLYSRILAVPARRDVSDPVVREGEKLFRQVGCAQCHIPEVTTGISADLPELSHQRIQPFTDLLLHDMGEGLADGREVFEASGREWRTPPLWGIGLVKTVNGHTEFLHDGRARNLAEAILWHGGEAQKSNEQFRALSKTEREALLRFLESL